MKFVDMQVNTLNVREIKTTPVTHSAITGLYVYTLLYIESLFTHANAEYAPLLVRSRVIIYQLLRDESQ